MAHRIKFQGVPYQAELGKWMLDNSGMVIAPMGSGKTVTAATTLNLLWKGGHIKSGVVFAPFQVARHTWPNELMKWEHLAGLPWQLLAGNDPVVRSNFLHTPFII